jgi:hypothetical protein
MAGCGGFACGGAVDLVMAGSPSAYRAETVFLTLPEPSTYAPGLDWLPAS